MGLLPRIETWHWPPSRRLFRTPTSSPPEFKPFRAEMTLRLWSRLQGESIAGVQFFIELGLNSQADLSFFLPSFMKRARIEPSATADFRMRPKLSAAAVMLRPPVALFNDSSSIMVSTFAA
jgi:hypothetical protein